MANWTSGALTAAGRALQLKVEAGATLELTRMKLGQASHSQDVIDGMTDLAASKAILAISSVVVEGETCKVTGILRTQDVAEGFYPREWGLFAKDPDRGEILYLVSTDNSPDYIPSAASAVHESATYTMHIAVSNASTVQVVVNPQGIATNEALTDSAGLVERLHSYSIDELLYDRNFHRHDFRLLCIQAGTTGGTLLDLSHANIGDIIEDGTVRWKVVRLQTTDDTQYVPLDADSTVTFQIGYDAQGVYMITPDA